MPDGAIWSLFDVPEQDIPAPPPPKIGMVTETGLALRDGPGTNYFAITKLQGGAQLDLLERYQDWYHIGIPGGSDGWVRGDFLTIDQGINERLLVAGSIPDPNPALLARSPRITSTYARAPNSRYTKVGGVGAGAKVDLIGKYKDWFQIRLENGTKAWVFSDFLNATERVVRRVPVSKNFPALPVVARNRAGGASADSPASPPAAMWPASRYASPARAMCMAAQAQGAASTAAA